MTIVYKYGLQCLLVLHSHLIFSHSVSNTCCVRGYCRLIR